MIVKYGWFGTLMRIADNDPRLIDYWVDQPFRKLLLHLSYLADDFVFQTTKLKK